MATGLQRSNQMTINRRELAEWNNIKGDLFNGTDKLQSAQLLLKLHIILESKAFINNELYYLRKY